MFSSEDEAESPKLPQQENPDIKDEKQVSILDAGTK